MCLPCLNFTAQNKIHLLYSARRVEGPRDKMYVDLICYIIYMWSCCSKRQQLATNYLTLFVTLNELNCFHKLEFVIFIHFPMSRLGYISNSIISLTWTAHLLFLPKNLHKFPSFPFATLLSHQTNGLKCQKFLPKTKK